MMCPRMGVYSADCAVWHAMTPDWTYVMLQQTPCLEISGIKSIMSTLISVLMMYTSIMSYIFRDVYPLLWRFLPVLDVQVSAMFSRDLDSLPTPRETAAVNEFLNATIKEVVSEKNSSQNENPVLHIMRDHKFHLVEILGRH